MSTTLAVLYAITVALAYGAREARRVKRGDVRRVRAAVVSDAGAAKGRAVLVAAGA